MCAEGWHTWLVTDTYSGGLAGWFNSDLDAEMREHASNVQYSGFECTPIPEEDVDEACVDESIAPGTSHGIYFPIFNDCQVVITRILHRCSTSDRLWGVSPVLGVVGWRPRYYPPSTPYPGDYTAVSNPAFDFASGTVVYH